MKLSSTQRVRNDSVWFLFVLGLIALSKCNLHLNSIVNGKIRYLFVLSILSTIIFRCRIVLKKNELIILSITILYIGILGILRNDLFTGFTVLVLFVAIIYGRRIHPSDFFWMIMFGVWLLFTVYYILFGRQYCAVYESKMIRGASQNGSINPNLIGFMAFIFLSLFAMVLRNKELKHERIVLAILTMCTIVVQINMQDRTAMLGSILLFILSNKRLLSLFNSPKRIKIMICSIVMGGLFIPFFIVNHIMPNNPIMVDKLLSGRELVWRNLIQAISQKPSGLFFGFGSAFEESISEGLVIGSSMHNSYFQMTLYFGIVSVVFLTVLLIIEVNNMFKHPICDAQRILIASTMIILLMSYTEVILQHNTFFVFIGLIIGLATNNSWLDDKSRLKMYGKTYLTCHKPI